MFDLCERVKLGLNFLNNNVDKNRDCLPYFATMFKNDPAEARHDWPDFGDLTARYVEAFVFARRMLGIKKVGDVEEKLKNLLLSYFNEGDGLSYRPKPKKPYYSTILRKEYDEHVAEGFDQARVLWGLLAWESESHDPQLKLRIEELVRGLESVMVKKENYGYYDRSVFQPGIKVEPNAEPMPHQFYFCGTQIHPLIGCYNQLGVEKALNLAVRLSNYIVYHSNYFTKHGVWNCDLGDDWTAEIDGHAHSRFATIAGIANVGIVIKDMRLTEFAKQCYDWFVKTHGSDFGWSPEFLGRYGDEKEGCETCAIMDQINCCLAFCKAGYLEYFEQIEKLARNQLMENQLLDTSIFKDTVEKPDTELSCFHDVAGMVRGGFAGWAGPNDFIGNCEHHYCLMNCCGPAGIRAFYDVWENVYTLTDNDIFINIWIDKSDENISIQNLQPRQGKLDITAKSDRNLYLNRRMWLDVDRIKILVNNTEVRFGVNQNYIYIEGLKSDDNIIIDYPLTEEKKHSNVNGRDYDVEWIGDTVTEIDPPGKIMPLYKNRK